MRKVFLGFGLIMVCLSPAFSGNGDKDKKVENSVSAETIQKIRKEGLENSKVMEYAFYLTDVSGPRVTASPGYMRAATWAKSTLDGLGLKNVKVEPWGDFGKGWEMKKCYVAMTAPYYTPIIAMPKVWTQSTPANLKEKVILVKAKDSTTFVEQYKGKLKGKIVMVEMLDTLRPSFEADGERYDDSVLNKMANAQPVVRDNPDFRMGNDMARRFQRMNLLRRVNDLINQEEPALVLSMNARGNDGTIFVQGGGQYQPGTPDAPASVVISSDEYLRMQRLINAGIDVTLEADVQTRTYTDDMKGYNVLAEIPGTDPKLKDEIVMLGAHLDSWQGSTGATDNAAGSAVMLEAVRILKAAGLQPRRTIRIALWGGEEQGLHGSRNWVKANIADPADMVLKPLHEKISGYFNLDNGTGRIRGVYCQGNKEVMPIFSQWLEPFHDLDAKTVTINNTG
ncbi:MAG: M20/M25/M40 family metallo-hydrolase, partial [Chitinophagaceae bacterium]|nr:M20/M25/M40 family metallo-hydrolase [Chitinophagaceae bacterium]